MGKLTQWLCDKSQRVKFVITSVPFFPDTKKENEDKWGGYKRQRDEIISCIRANSIQKVVFLSGDVHCSMAAALNIGYSNGPPLKIYSIISSSFYWPYSHMKQRQFQLTGSVAMDNGGDYILEQVTNVFSGDNFTRVKVSQEHIEIEVYERKGDLVHTDKFRF